MTPAHNRVTSSLADLTATSHVDTFARDHLPWPALWPEFLFTLPQLHYPERLNCAAALIDAPLAQGHGSRRAVISETATLTYAELAADANRIAHVLCDDLGLVPGNRVLLRGFNNEVQAAAWLGVIKAGGVVVTTMPLLRAKELRDAIGLARIEFALCDGRVRDDFDGALEGDSPCTRIVYTHDDAPTGLRARMAAHPATFAAVDTAADDVCMIAFTSGTTGRPKGTMHFHRDVLAICDTFAPAMLNSRPDDIFTGTPPLGFTFGLGALLLFPLRAGATTLLIERPTPQALLAAIQGAKATMTFAAPTSYRAMTALAAQYDLGSLRACVSAGETLSVATRAAWRAATGIEMIDGIGSTEMLHIFISAGGADVRPGATGKVVPGYCARIVGDDGRPLEAGAVGRLAVKGPTGCRYLAVSQDSGTAAAAASADDPRQREYVQDGWNITGDAYLMDADGYFWYQGRTDDMIVSAGYNIAAAEVEAALLEHPLVADCAVVGVPDQARGTIVKAYVVRNSDVTGASPTCVSELQDFVKARIAPYKYPRAIEFVPTLPRTQTGKLQRFKLRSAREPT